MANQIKKKYIQDAAIDGEKLELLEGQSVKLKKDGGEVVNLLQLNQEDKILLKGEEAALKSQVDAEQERAEGEESRIEGKIDQEITDRQDAVSQEEAARIAGDESLDGRLSPIEEILEYSKSVIYESNSSVFADGAKGKEDQNLREGWYYTNDGSDLGLSGDNKINWYFFDGQQNQVSLSDFSGYAVMTFDDNSESPILSVYTFPTGSGDAASWYHSRVNYSGFSEQPEVGKQYLVYFGQDPQIHPELPRLEINKSNSTSVGDQEGSELVSTSAFGTNSSAPQGNVKFLVEHLGVYSPEFKSDIKLKIHYATQEEFDSLQSQVDALDGNFATDEELSQAVSDLQDEIDADVLVEKTRAEGEESRIEGKVDQEVSNRVTAISQEEASRIAADIELQNNLNQEIEDRESEVSRVEGLISDEETRAKGEESRIEGKLEGLISDEETRAMAEELRLSGLISDEEASRISDVTSLQNQINDILSNTDPAALDSLTEIVSAFQSADSNLSAAITSAIGQHQTELQEFKDEINPKVSTLESEMDAVEGRATTLESEMDAVEGRATTLESEMDNAEGRLDVIEGDSSVEGSIAKAQSDAVESARSYTDSANDSLYEFVSAEIDADVLVEKNRAEGEESRIEGKLDQEIQDRQDADIAIQDELDATQAGAGLEADGSFVINSSAYAVPFINGGDYPTSLKGYVQLIDDGLADVFGRLNLQIYNNENELDATQAGAGLEADGSFATLEYSSSIVDINGDELSSVTNLKSYVQIVDSAVGLVKDNLDQEIIDRDTAIEAAFAVEKDPEVPGSFQNQISDISSALDNQLDPSVEGSLAKQIADEVSDRESADNTLQQNIDTEKARIDAILEASTADKDSFKEIVELINSVDTENDNAFAGYKLSNDARVLAVEGEVDVLQGEMDAVEGRATTLEGEMDAVEGRLDTVEPKVTTLESEMDTAQSDISTLQSGLSQEIQDRTDANNTLQSNINAEESARISADQALDGRVQVLESVTWSRDIFVVSQTDIDNGYVDFSFEVVPGSVMGFVDRLGIHEGEDFTLSTEGGVTRMTFAGDLVDPGQIRLAVGDRLYMSYQYKA